jgi:epoxyqueuosine reductase
MVSSEQIKTKALEIGFDACGIARAELLEEDIAFLSSWLEKDYCAGMGYMKNYFDKRLNPTLLVENARSVIVVLLNYYPSQVQDDAVPQIAKYAYGKDYHVVMKQRLHQLFDEIQQLSPEKKISGRAFVDSAPVLERRWAARAGLGWIGKNTLLINPKVGSFTFIGELIVDVELDYDKPMENRCGDCEKCIKSCPTKALCEPYIVNANRCFSYQTIENKNDIPAELQDKLGNRLFGCDTCQQVCPYNKQIKGNKIKEFDCLSDILSMDKKAWEDITEEQFKQLFADSSLLRAGYKKIKATLNFL